MTPDEKEKQVYQTEFNSYTAFLQKRSKDKYPDKLQELADRRKIPLQVFEDEGVFYIGKKEELLNPMFHRLLPDFGVVSPTNREAIYHDRWIFPIKDMQGNILNFVGYSPEEHERYVYGTAKYYSRSDDVYGLDNISLAYELGFAIITEGITDSYAYKGIGYKNSFAMCGTSKSLYKEMIFNRVKYGVLKVVDRDFAGLATINRWKFKRSLLIITPYTYKDSAQALEEEKWREHFKLCLPQVVDYLKEKYEKGLSVTDEPIYL